MSQPQSKLRATASTLVTRVPVPRLEFVVERERGKPSNRTLVVDADVIAVGSHPNNQVVLEDPQVSGFHFRLSRHPRGWRLEDTGSLNGTRVGGLFVREADLGAAECRIDLGDSRVVVRELPFGTTEPATEGVSCGTLFGQSPPMRRLFHAITTVAKTDATVLIQGETGTGKELVAGEIVQHSSRRNKPLVVVDCGAIPTNLIESELFGHARGAFTGAHQARVGAFEAASGGTVFLDELGELPLEMQPRLLRAIAQREIRRMGENQTRPIDVRVISATNRDLEREVNAGRFRADLYYRLAVVTLRLPPLRDRTEDIPLLVEAMLASMGAMDKGELFTQDVYDELASYRWPGNVRELRNFVERRVVADLVGVPSNTLRTGSERGAEPASPPQVSVDLDVPFKEAKDALVGAFEEAYLRALFAWARGNVSKAARKAKIDRMHVHRLMQRHGIERAGDDAAPAPKSDNDD